MAWSLLLSVSRPLSPIAGTEEFAERVSSELPPTSLFRAAAALFLAAGSPMTILDGC